MKRALFPVLALAGCGQPPLALPEEPLARASTCTAVRALELREGKSRAGPVSFDGFTEILHFAMIHAAQQEVEADLRQLITVSQRAPVAMQELQGREWDSLVEPCNAAFPETQKQPGPLLPDPYEAGMTCFALADFLAKTAIDYPADRDRMAALAQRSLGAAQPTLRVRAKDNNNEAHRIASGYAARAFKAGRPASLLDQCERRFPPPG